MDKLRADLQKQYDTSLSDSIKAKNDEIERLKSENASLQANAQKPAKAPDDIKTRVKFYLNEIQNTFNSAVETVCEVESADEKAKYKGAFKAVIQELDTIVNNM